MCVRVYVCVCMCTYVCACVHMCVLNVSLCESLVNDRQTKHSLTRKLLVYRIDQWWCKKHGNKSDRNLTGKLK